MLQPPAGRRTAPSTPGSARRSPATTSARDPPTRGSSHDLTLAIDAYGNVTRHASVGYPRRDPTGADDAGRADDGADQLPRGGLRQRRRQPGLVPHRTADRDARLRADRHRADRASAARPRRAASQPRRRRRHPLRGDTRTARTSQRRLLGRQRTIYQSNELAELPFDPLDLGRGRLARAGLPDLHAAQPRSRCSAACSPRSSMPTS